MKIKNHEIVSLYELLMSLELSGKKSRMRTRFCKLLAKQSEVVESERLQLLNEFADKDETGQIKTVQDGDNTIFSMSEENKVGFVNELNTLMNEDFHIEESEEHRDMLMIVSDALLNLDIPMSGQKAMEYDRFCEAFEEINY